MYFGALLGPSVPFWVLLGPSGMKSPFAKFQHFLRHIGWRRSGNPYSSLLDTLGLFRAIFYPFGLFCADLKRTQRAHKGPKRPTHKGSKGPQRTQECPTEMNDDFLTPPTKVMYKMLKRFKRALHTKRVQKSQKGPKRAQIGPAGPNNGPKEFKSV